MKDKKEKKPRSWKRITLMVLCVVLTLILIVLLLGIFYVNHLLGRINYVDKNKETTMSPEEVSAFLATATDAVDPSLETLDPTDVTWGTGPTVPVHGDNIVNILLIGQDRREGQERQRSDTMILCTINKTTKTLTMTSFLRDLLLPIPGRNNSDKLGHPYRYGGMTLLDATLEANFGVHVDVNFEVDFNGFIKVIDKVGGLDIELTSAEAKYMNKANWEIPGERNWNLKKGVNHLTGEQALAYARIRAIDATGDVKRTQRQRIVLDTLLNECKKKDFGELLGILNEVLPSLTTDWTKDQILSFVTDVFPILSDLTVISQRIPADGTFKNAAYKGMSVLVIEDMEANLKLLADTMSGGPEA